MMMHRNNTPLLISLLFVVLVSSVCAQSVTQDIHGSNSSCGSTAVASFPLVYDVCTKFDPIPSSWQKVSVVNSSYILACQYLKSGDANCTGEGNCVYVRLGDCIKYMNESTNENGVPVYAKFTNTPSTTTTTTTTASPTTTTRASTTTAPTGTTQTTTQQTQSQTTTTTKSSSTTKTPTSNTNPTTSNTNPTTSNTNPTTSNTNPTTSNTRPTTSNTNPTTSQQTPTTTTTPQPEGVTSSAHALTLTTLTTAAALFIASLFVF